MRSASKPPTPHLIALKDAIWAIRHDRLRTARNVGQLAGRDASANTLGGYLPIQQALSAIDRLEVRGRDSAGIHVFVWGHDIDAAALASMVAQRGVDPLFQSNAVIEGDGSPVVRLQGSGRDRRTR